MPNGPTEILIVEDEPHLCLLYESALTRAGYETLTAQDATVGLELARTMDPDLIVLDLRMPGLDGLDVIRRLRNDRNDVSIVINTAYNGYLESDLADEADACVLKSSDVTELIDTVDALT